MLLSFANSIQQLDPAGEMRAGFQRDADCPMLATDAKRAAN
jgi:hypothetical protein